MIDSETRAACEAAVGRTRVIDDSLSPEVAARLGTVLRRPLADDRLPPCWHWAWFNPAIPAADRGHDLHERTGLFLPAAPFERRMWAGGTVTMHRPLRLARPARQTVQVRDVSFKQGRSGAMCFVTVGYRITQDGRTCIDEIRTIVYRDRSGPREPALRGPGDPVPDGFHVYDDGTLFFYSAITHNGHRIHWDRDFCRSVEGYPDLVVHGPLLATDLCDTLRDGFTPCRYSYRAMAPVFTTSPVRIEAGPVQPRRDGRILRSDGVIAMTATCEPT